MICALCGGQNQAGASYCSQCGVMLGLRCPECAAANNPRARRCGACGAVLHPAEAVRPSATPAPRESRRIVTVLFADIVGFTGMVESYGDQAEAVRSLLKECFDALAAIALEQGGTVEKFIGDAVCALFGAPSVHEDDPQRALSAALQMQRAMERLNRLREERSQDDGKPLQLRIGISTGEVVGGTAEHAGEQQYSVTGDAVNTASRLQSSAGQGQILVSAMTERLARDRFTFEPVGEIKLKGKRAPISTFLVVGERAEDDATGGIFINRRQEIDHLCYCLNLAGQGAAQLVEMVGDAGVGKSRLVEAFVDQAGAGTVICRGSCPPLAASSLYPFQSVAAGLLAAAGSDLGDLDGAIPVLEQIASGAGLVEEDDPIEAAGNAIHTAIRALPATTPTAIIIENVHRADPDTLDLLRRLVSTVRDERLMLLWTRRTGEDLPIEGDTLTSLTRLIVRPLAEADAHELMRHLLGPAEIPQSVSDLIVERSGGNPLYIEAMVRGLVEDDDLLQRAESLETVQIPATVQGLIQSRLDNIPEQQKLLIQEAAVVGREFDAELLQRVDLFGIDVATTLELLARRGMIEHIGGPRYSFRHVLTQEVAYDTMLEGLRTELHREVAESLVDLYPDRMTEMAPVLADHFAKAGDTDRAVEVLVQAGQAEG